MKLLACDFDGTLYFPGKEAKISTEDIEAIKKFQSTGHLFGFCTGRPIYGIINFLDNQIDADFYITNSGATIFDKNKN